MFADSLLDTPWTARSRRGWTTLASFALQAAAAGVLLLLPLLYTQGLPQLQLMSALVAQPHPRRHPLRDLRETLARMSAICHWTAT